MLLVTSHFETVLRTSYALNLSTSDVFCKQAKFDFHHMIAHKEGVNQIITFILQTSSQNFFFSFTMRTWVVDQYNKCTIDHNKMRSKSNVKVYGQEKQRQRIQLHWSFNHRPLIINTLSLQTVQTQIEVVLSYWPGGWGHERHDT